MRTISFDMDFFGDQSRCGTGCSTREGVDRGRSWFCMSRGIVLFVGCTRLALNRPVIAVSLRPNKLFI